MVEQSTMIEEWQCGHYLYFYSKKGQQHKLQKLHPGHKQMHYTANTTAAPCKHLHIQHAKTKLAKNPE